MLKLESFKEEVSREKFDYMVLENMNGASTHNGRVDKISLFREPNERDIVLQHEGLVDKKTGNYMLQAEDPEVVTRRFWFGKDFTYADAQEFLSEWEPKHKVQVVFPEEKKEAKASLACSKYNRVDC